MGINTHNFVKNDLRLVCREVKKSNFKSDAEKPDYLLLFEDFLLMSYLLSHGTSCQYRN